jgi:hypothetical protein
MPIDNLATALVAKHSLLHFCYRHWSGAMKQRHNPTVTPGADNFLNKIVKYLTVGNSVNGGSILSVGSDKMYYVVVWRRCHEMNRVRSRGAGISIIGGADIHIFVFCPINFFWNRLFLQSVHTNIWISAPPIIDIPAPLVRSAYQR